MKEIEELMKPRIKMIALVPEYGMKVGTIITQNDNLTFELTPTYSLNLTGIRQYPHIYKEISWWEERSIEGMPEYVKHTIQGETTYHKIIRWDMSDPNFITGYQEDNGGCNIGMWAKEHTYQPATKEEYQSYQSIKSLK